MFSLEDQTLLMNFLISRDLIVNPTKMKGITEQYKSKTLQTQVL